MNPSYNNGSGSNAGGQPGSIGTGNLGTPGTKPGVIASGPDPADAPVNTPVATPTTPMSLGDSGRSRISSLLGKRKMNTSGATHSAAPSAAPIMLAGTNGEERSSKKKFLVIGALAFAVILIVVLAVVALMGKGGGNGGVGSSFNELINYVTSGQELKTDVNDDYDAMANYYFLNTWEDKDQKKQVYDTTKTLMDNFVAKYKDGENDALNKLVKSTKEQFDFMYVVDLGDKVYYSTAMMAIIKNGDTKAKQNLMNRYNFNDLGDNSYAKSFLETYGEWIDALIAQVKLYKDNGCVFNDVIDMECMANKNDEALKNTLSEIGSNVASLSSVVVDYYDQADNFVGGVYYINNMLHGKPMMMEVENE